MTSDRTDAHAMTSGASWCAAMHCLKQMGPFKCHTMTLCNGNFHAHAMQLVGCDSHGELTSSGGSDLLWVAFAGSYYSYISHDMKGESAAYRPVCWQMWPSD